MMNTSKAIITLIRLPNLVFIFLTQLLVYYFIIQPAVVATGKVPTLHPVYALVLSFSTVLIATAGYMINDYFDIGIDAINKPGRVTIEKIFKRRTIIFWHVLLNIIGLALASYIAFQILLLRFALIQLLCIVLLVFYSTTFKRKLIIGNFVISILSALTLVTMAVYEPNFELFNIHFKHSKLLWMYVCFSFLITFIREVIKDIEDVKGDTVQNCQTIPLVWGILTAKKISYFLLLLLAVLLVVMDIYFFSFNKVLVFFLSVNVLLFILFISRKIFKATISIEFHQISTYIKVVTLFGILSMILI